MPVLDGWQVLALQVGQPVGLMALDPVELLLAHDLRDSGQTEVVTTRRRHRGARVRFADGIENRLPAGERRVQPRVQHVAQLKIGVVVEQELPTHVERQVDKVVIEVN